MQNENQTAVVPIQEKIHLYSKINALEKKNDEAAHAVTELVAAGVKILSKLPYDASDEITAFMAAVKLGEKYLCH